MSAPRKATGGRKTKRAAELKLGGEIRPHKGRNSPPSLAASPEDAPGRPPHEGSGGVGRAIPKPPQGHGGVRIKAGRTIPRGERPPRYSTANAKQRMLAAAAEAAQRRGYEALRICDITDPINVTRQAFYAHFRDKRHCLAEVIDPRLGSIERMAASAEGEQPGWAVHVMHAIDEAIYERFASEDGTRGRLIAAITEMLRESGSLNKVRIGALVKRARVPQADFYRQFSGKRECFAVAYEAMLEQLVDEVRESVDAGGSVEPRASAPALLGALGEALAFDPIRLRLLVVEATQLPEADSDELAGAWRGSLVERVDELLGGCEGVEPDDPRIALAAASVVEVIRSAITAGEVEDLRSRLEWLTSVLPAQSQSDADFSWDHPGCASDERHDDVLEHGDRVVASRHANRAMAFSFEFKPEDAAAAHQGSSRIASRALAAAQASSSGV